MRRLFLLLLSAVSGAPPPWKATTTEAEMERLVERYPMLFLKAAANLSNPLLPISYDVVASEKMEFATSKRIIAAHLHCFDLSQFLAVYGPYMPVLRAHCKIWIVTYCIGDGRPGWMEAGDILLRTPNKGMDVGAKFCAMHYIMTTVGERKPAMILFLHSKSDVKQRFRYFEWYIEQLQLIPDVVDQEIGGIFNPYLILEQRGWKRNSRYMKDLVGYFDLEDDYFAFPEGNCFILSYDMAVNLYNDSRAYQMLNTNNSTDFAWILEYYSRKKLKKKGIKDIQRSIAQGKMVANNLMLNKGHAGLADSMIEHAYERLPMLMLRRHNKKGVFSFSEGKPVPRNFDEYAKSAAKLGYSLNLLGRDKLPPSHRQMRYWPLLDYADLREKFFSKKRTKHDRVVVMSVSAQTTSDPLRLSALINNLFYYAQVAFEIIIVEERTKDRSAVVDAIDESMYRDFFLVNARLTDEQVLWYANNHFDLLEHFSELDQLRQHYIDYGCKEPRFVPYVIAQITVIQAPASPFGRYAMWLTGLYKKVNVSHFTDFILADDKFLITRSLLPFAEATFNADASMSALLGSNDGGTFHYPDLLRRYNRRGITKVYTFYFDTISAIPDGIDISEGYLFENFEAPSSSLFLDSYIVTYHAAEAAPVNIHFDYPYVKNWIAQRGHAYELVHLDFRKRRKSHLGGFDDDSNGSSTLASARTLTTDGLSTPLPVFLKRLIRTDSDGRISNGRLATHNTPFPLTMKTIT